MYLFIYLIYLSILVDYGLHFIDFHHMAVNNVSGGLDIYLGVGNKFPNIYESECRASIFMYKGNITELSIIHN